MDQANLQEHIAAYTTLRQAVDHFTTLTNDQVIFNDSMTSQLWKLNIGRYLQFNRGPYDALKSSGIDRVSNDSIRNHLINFFDFKLLEFQTEIEHSTRRYRSNVDLLLSFRKNPHLDENNNWVINRIPEDILQKPKFIWLLTDIEWRASNSVYAIEEFTPEIETLIRSINNEITKD